MCNTHLCRWSSSNTVISVGGAFSGAITGAMAGWASNRGLLRGSVLGAAAGTVLSLEILEAVRAYWCLEQTGEGGASSIVSLSPFITPLLDT